MRKKLFLGWWIVGAIMVTMSMGMGPFAIASFGVFMGPLAQEFGWNRAELAGCMSLLIASTAVSIIFLGPLVDRYGPRAVLFPSIVAMSLVLASIPLFATRLWQLQILYVLCGIATAGTNVFTYMPILSSWFNRHRGLAIGLSVSGIGLGYAYVPVMLQTMIDAAGWRAGYYLLAALSILIALPLAHLALIDTPAMKGLHPDGLAGPLPPETQRDVGLTFASALRAREFWVMLVLFLCLTFTTYGVFIHFVPMMTDRGLTPALAAALASIMGLTVFGGRVLFGLLVDRFFAPRVALVAQALACVGIVILALDVGGAPLYLAAFLIGLLIGAESDLLAYLSSRYFGLRALGTLFGLQTAAYMAGIALGPVALGLGYEATGSYQTVLWSCIGVLLLAMILTALLRPFPDWRMATVAVAGEERDRQHASDSAPG